MKMESISTAKAQEIIDSKNALRITRLVDVYELSVPLLRQLLTAKGTTAYIRSRAEHDLKCIEDRVKETLET